MGMERAKESSSKFGFSWADEVEREEEEQQNQIQVLRQKEVEKASKRVDPFGAARPREVILEEKGVDWKKLDQDFSFDSSVRECITKKSITTKKPLVIQNPRSALPCQQTGSCEEPVPPLKYPPKNINLVFEEIRRARKLKLNNCENTKTTEECDENTVLVGCSDAKWVTTNSVKESAANAGAPREPQNAQWVPKAPTNRKVLSNLNSVLVNSNKKGFVAKEKTGSNFELKSVKEDGTKKEQEPGQRRVLMELNNSSSKKAPRSNSYFGVLELLEPSSHEKSSSRKWVGVGGNGSARKRSAVLVNEELGARKQKQATTTVNRRKKEKRSKR